ncbi:MAG: DUF4395 family protein [Armatimonadetes bacterium]|nr:DUF4395 family protein [Anaerolineae bacterium]
MASIKIPTPLRAYAGGEAQVTVAGATVGAALNDLVTQHPDLKAHLFNGDDLRSFVNVFLDDEDVRFLEGMATEIGADAALRIIPSIAGGNANVRKIDQTALKTGQLLTIVLLVTAFVMNSPLLVLLVGLAQLTGALALPYAPYKLAYERVVKPLGIAKPNLQLGTPEPHRFALLVGALFNFTAALMLWAGAGGIGWGLVAVVLVLANLNLWLNFCAGCWMYYQLHRLGIPGFTQARLS